METMNKIAKTVSIAEEKARYDEHCKKLLSFKIFLAHILKECFDEFKDYDVNEISDKYIEGEPIVSESAVHQDEKILGMNTEDTAITEKTVRYDILFYAFVPVLKETVKIIVNIELQNDFYPGYPLLKRGVYYCSRLISSQLGKEFDNENYKNIKKVFSVWVCTNVPKNKKNTITRFSFTRKNLIGNANFKKSDYDLMEIIMVCLGEDDKSKNYSGVLKLLSVLLSDKISSAEKKRIMESEYNIKMTRNIESEVFDMCNLSDGVYNRGLKAGIETGKIEGGINSITKMCKEFGISFVDTVKRVIEDYNLSEEEAEEEVRKRWEK